MEKTDIPAPALLIPTSIEMDSIGVAPLGAAESIDIDKLEEIRPIAVAPLGIGEQGDRR